MWRFNILPIFGVLYKVPCGSRCLLTLIYSRNLKAQSLGIYPGKGFGTARRISIPLQKLLAEQLRIVYLSSAHVRHTL